MNRWTLVVYRARFLVIAAWVVVAVLSALAVSGAFGTKLNDLLSNRFELPGTESNTARLLLQQHFGQRDDSTFLLVVRWPRGVRVDPAVARAAVARVVRTLPQSRPAPLQRAGSDALYASIGTALPPDVAQRYVARIRAAVGPLPGARAYLTGQVATNKDLQPTFDSDLQRGEMIALPIALLVLLFIFGTLVATAAPLVMALATVPVTLGAVWAIAHFLDMAIYVTNLVTLIGIAIAIDYSLLVVYRYREELARTSSVLDALQTTMRTAGRAVLFSGVTVAIGLGLLVLMPLPFIRSMGVGGIVIPLVSVFAAMTLLPALLGVMGGGVNRLRVVPQRVMESRDDSESGLWARLSRAIIKRPALVAGITGGALVAAAVPAVFLSLTLGSTRGLPQGSESVQGLTVLEQRLGPGAVSPSFLVVDTGRAGGASSALPAVRRLSALLRADPEVSSVQSPTDRGAPAAFHVDPSRRYLRLVVASRHDYGTDQTKKLVGRIRDRYVPEARFGSARVYAGGAPPTGVDFIARAYGVFPWLVLGVLVITYLVLLRAFRSLVLPLKAVLLNLLSVGATYGLLVITFRWGAGTLIGLPQFNQIEAWIPIFLFAMLFGLSMDYEVFLLSRMREVYDETGDTDTAIAMGLQKTGRIVTAAAAIMVAAFSGFVLGSLLGLRQFGWGLAVAIFIDATLVRALLVPALMKLMGRWNWYLPHGVARLARVRVAPRDEAPESP